MNPIHMTDEYAAQYFHKMGWMWARLEVLKEKENWGTLRDKRIEAELRQKLAREIEVAREEYIALADDPFYKGLCNGMFYAMQILTNPKDEVIKKFPRAYWWCKDCRLGSSMWYETTVPVWNCPRCNKQWEPYGKANVDDNE